MAMLGAREGLSSLSSILAASVSAPAAAYLLGRHMVPSAVTAVIPFRWKRFLARLRDMTADGRGDGSAPLFFSEFEGLSDPSSPPPATGLSPNQRQASVPRLTGPQFINPSDLEREVRSTVSEAIASVLGVAPESIPSDAPLMALGLDSLGAVELRNSLEAALSLPLSGTFAFDHPTLDSIVTMAVAAKGRIRTSEQSGYRIARRSITEEGPPEALWDQVGSSGDEGSLISLSSRPLGSGVWDWAVQEVGEKVLEVVSSILGTSTPPDPDSPLAAAGLDSLGAVELRNSLQV